MVMHFILMLAAGAAQADSPPAADTKPEPKVVVRTEVVEITSDGPQAPRIVSTGPPEDAFFNLHKEPRVVETRIGGPPVTVRPDAVIAGETIVVELDRGAIDGPLKIPKPFGVYFPAGAIVMAGMVRGEVRRCLYLGGDPNDPPRDDRERSMICLADKNGDSLFETVRVYSDQGKGPPRDFAVEPVGVAPAPSGYTHMADQRLVQRLRIEAIDEKSVTIRVERSMGVNFEGTDSTFFPVAPGKVTLPLREGAEADLAGVAMKIESNDGAWSIRTGGAFDRWVSLAEGGVRVNTGESARQRP